MPWINVDLCSSDIHQFYLINGKQPASDLLSCELSLETFLLTWIGMLFVKIISGGLAYATRRARPAQWAVTILESLIHTAPQGPAVLKNITSPHYLLVWCVCVWGGMEDTFTYGFHLWCPERTWRCDQRCLLSAWRWWSWIFQNSCPHLIRFSALWWEQDNEKRFSTCWYMIWTVLLLNTVCKSFCISQIGIFILFYFIQVRLCLLVFKWIFTIYLLLWLCSNELSLWVSRWFYNALLVSFLWLYLFYDPF